MTNTILLTGASGFVGRQVHAALRLHGSDLKFVQRRGTPLSGNERNVVFSPDLFAEDSAWWARTCKDVDTIIHLAWFVEPGRYLQNPANLDCLSGTLQLAKGAALAKVRRFIGIGTCVEYDLDRGPLDVDTPLRPLTPYAAAKAAAFLALSQTLPKLGMEFGWCRLFYLYGEGEHGSRLAPSIRSHLSRGEPIDLTSGSQFRDYLDVEEAGRRITSFALGRRQGPVNICSGKAVTVREFAERIASEYGREDLLHFGRRKDDQFDPPSVVGVPSEALA